MVNTYVTSVNGLTGDDFYELIGTLDTDQASDKIMNFTPAHSRNKHVRIDSQDIKVTGETGDSIKQKCDSIAGGMQRLLLSETETEGDYVLQIQYGYPIVYTA